MRMRFTILSFATLILFASSCSTVMPGKTKASSKKNTYSEDLTAYRPEPIIIEEQPVERSSAQVSTDTAAIYVTEKLNTVLDTAATYARSTIKYIDGFTIQVYGGDDRAAAKDYRLNLIRNCPST